ncbi:MAG: hypothetical protein WDN28_30330 [Chthoniobacter sp.]
MSAVLSLAFLAGLAAEAAVPKPSREQIEQNTRLQIFLDNANFGPGKIDGTQGEFTQKALALYRQAKGLPAVPPPQPKAPLDTTGLDLSRAIALPQTTWRMSANCRAVRKRRRR